MAKGKPAGKKSEKVTVAPPPPEAAPRRGRAEARQVGARQASDVTTVAGAQTTLPQAPAWAARIGPDNTVIVQLGDAEPVTMDSQAAARLGISMMAVSVINAGPPQRPAVGTGIESVHFPVRAWSVGRSTVNGEPVLLVTLPGGSTLMLQLNGQGALACGQALVRESRIEQLPAGAKPN